MKEPATVFISDTPDRPARRGGRNPGEYKFSAVRISRSDNLVFPDRLTIDADKVVFYKGKLIGYDSTTVLRENIGGVSVSADILFADITIETSGGQKIVAEGFSKSSARTIKRILGK